MYALKVNLPKVVNRMSCFWLGTALPHRMLGDNIDEFLSSKIGKC